MASSSASSESSPEGPEGSDSLHSSDRSLDCCLLHQKYILLKLLGEGSYGKVLKCQKNEDNTMVAVKIILLDDTREGKERREVRAHSTLSGHPNIVRFYESWEDTRKTTCIEDDLVHDEDGAEPDYDDGAEPDYDDGAESDYDDDAVIEPEAQGVPVAPMYIPEIFIVMEYCHETIQGHQDGHSISKRKAWAYFKELVTALQHIHSEGFVHRDISIANLFLSSDGRLVVGDFGFAIEVEDADVFDHGYNTKLCSAEVGTKLYAAPEIMSPEPQEVGCLADIYSAGIVLIVLLDPFKTGWERVEVLEGINHGHFPDTLLPMEASYIRRLVSPDAEDRPSAQTILAEFDEDTHSILAAYPSETSDEDTSDDSD